MTSKEIGYSIAGVLITAIVMFGFDYFTDAVEGGQELADRELILKVLAEQELKAADGRPLAVAVNELTVEVAKINVQLPFLTRAVERLNE